MNGDELSANDRAARANVSDLIVQSAIDYEMHILDLEGRVASWSPGAQKIKGYAAEEIVGKHFSIFYTEEDQAAGAPAHALQLAREEGRFQTDGWRVRKDGSRYWAQVTINPILQDGTLVGFAKIARDITAERDAHLAALETGTRFRLLVQGVIDYAIYMLDPKGYITNWNTGAERIKGYSAAEIIGDHFSRFYTPEDFDNGVPQRALETARLKGRYEAEGWRVRKDGTRFWAAVVIDAIRNEAGELIGFAKVTRDLSERKAAEEELEKAREQLFQAQKMEAVGQLTGGVAHDFNNLLMAISGGLDLIKKRMHQGRIGEVDRYLEAVQTAASRAAALTHRLLAFSRRQTLDPEVVDANSLVRGIEELVSRTLGPSIELAIEEAEALQPIFCDPNQLENAVLNLCINARDAMPDGGKLTIRTATASLEADADGVDLTAGDYVTIAVTDTGVGMPPHVVASAFDPFFTTKPIGQGTGLGLSMVYGFAKQSGGIARIHSRVGIGTTVCLYLPAYAGQAAAPKAPVFAGAQAKGGEKILVVDDEENVRTLILEQLSDLGYVALGAASAMMARALLTSDRSIDLLVTDVGLPGGMNGRQLAEMAREIRPDLPVMFITGYAETSLARDDEMATGMHVMTKPFPIESLATRIRAILDGA